MCFIEDVEKCEDRLVEIVTRNSNTRLFNFENRFVLKYVFNQNCEVFEQIVEIYLKLQDRINLPKLLDYRIGVDEVVFLFEYVESFKEFEFSEQNLILMARSLSLFYSETRDFFLFNSFKSFVDSLLICDKKIERRVREVMKGVKSSRQRLVLEDIHFSNFILSKDERLFLIDLDNLMFAEVEYDLAKVFLLILKRCVELRTRDFLDLFNLFLKNFEFEFDRDKIWSYVEIIMLLKIDEYTNANVFEKRDKYVKLYDFFVVSRDFLDLF